MFKEPVVIFLSRQYHKGMKEILHLQFCRILNAKFYKKLTIQGEFVNLLDKNLN
ncbi:hypothetical protein AsAng_0018480 [Aureispira anguillae]|uniref:Uncharacterized protein n=1 Tax=Aureispira anguillae TaxID=2864201 RepID=A0A915YDN0_9BACT|nr:hypothetical protein AsAng_0018480 [Aureispira anguillae]